MTDDGIAQSAAEGFGIDGNRAVFEELIELLRSEKALAFVGAGASAPLYPPWDGLIEKLAADAQRLGIAEEARARFGCQEANDKLAEIAR